MSSHIPRSTFPQNQRSSSRGFTLIELLVVIAIVVILAGITFGIASGVKSAQARTRAKAELAVLAQGIEQFKLRYGDYPWHQSGDENTNRMLLWALTGRAVLEPNSRSGKIQVYTNTDQDSQVVLNRPKFIDETLFEIVEIEDEEYIVDPWGRPYVYWYKWSNQPEKWEVLGFHLYSMGPNGDTANEELKLEMEDEDTGVFGGQYRYVADENGIIFVGE